MAVVGVLVAIVAFWALLHAALGLSPWLAMGVFALFALGRAQRA